MTATLQVHVLKHHAAACLLDLPCNASTNVHIIGDRRAGFHAARAADGSGDTESEVRTCSQIMSSCTETKAGIL